MRGEPPKANARSLTMSSHASWEGCCVVGIRRVLRQCLSALNKGSPRGTEQYKQRQVGEDVKLQLPGLCPEDQDMEAGPKNLEIRLSSWLQWKGSDLSLEHLWIVHNGVLP